jgi:hypothetical protein
MGSYRALAVLGMILLLTVTAHAQVTFIQKETRNGESITSQIQMDKDHIRADARNGNDEAAFVFDVVSQTARMINLTQKSYMEVGKAEIDQISSMMAQVQEQLKNMPPDQRALVEQMMQGRGMPGLPAAQPKVNYRQAGSDKVGQWTCTKYEGFASEQKTSEVCTVDPKEFGLAASDFEAARQLAEMLKTFVPDLASAAFVNGTPNDQGYSGVPVRRTTFRNGAVDTVSEITEIRRGAIPASAFEVPAGFRKETMPGGPGLRGR